MARRTWIRAGLRARPLKRLIQREVLDRLARLVLSGDLRDGETVVIDADGNDLQFRTERSEVAAVARMSCSARALSERPHPNPSPAPRGEGLACRRSSPLPLESWGRGLG